MIGNYLKCLLLLDMQLKQGRVQMCVATRYATHQEVEFKCFKLHSFEWSLFIGGVINGQWTFLLY